MGGGGCRGLGMTRRGISTGSKLESSDRWRKDHHLALKAVSAQGKKQKNKTKNPSVYDAAGSFIIVLFVQSWQLPP